MQRHTQPVLKIVAWALLPRLSKIWQLKVSLAAAFVGSHRTKS